MSSKSHGRDSGGRFAKGHAGGPGRPRRPVETEYLAKLNAAVTLDTWRQIVDRAVTDATNGDAKARDWLAKYLIGEEPTSLVQLAADERAGVTADETIDALAIRQQLRRLVLNNGGMDRALLAAMARPARQAETRVPFVDERSGDTDEGS